MNETNESIQWRAAGEIAKLEILKAKSPYLRKTRGTENTEKTYSKPPDEVEEFLSRFFQYTNARRMTLAQVSKETGLGQSLILRLKQRQGVPTAATLFLLSKWSGVPLNGRAE